MSEHYRVRVSEDSLVFSAAHFITFDGGTCERLHGHNYRVGAEVRGPLDENYYVVDFVFLRGALRKIVDELDHRVLLPTGHPLLRVEAGEEEVEVRFGRRRWLFPRGDCLLLPLPNTTAELLARHVAGRLSEALRARCGRAPQAVCVEVEECPGQSAACELRPGE